MNFTVRAILAATLACGVAISSPALAAKRDPGFEARDAYYSGEIDRAFPMAIEAGETWVAGLAAYRLQDFDGAFDLFTDVAQDLTQDAWQRSSAAFWAARAAAAAGRSVEEQATWLATAAENPWTFYGMVAERQLGLAPGASFASTVLRPEVRMAEANDPLAMLIRISTNAMNPVGESGSRAYPVPDLTPNGGFVVDPALVYAVVRQESAFNATANSRVGARGLMQLMPATAALTTGDSRFASDRSLLNDPSVNLQIGQAYINQLATALVGDDLLRVIAAYNGGPGAVTKTIDRIGWDADPFMFIESLPAKETRDYVEKVVAGYWLYRRQFGEATPSLDALAAGQQRISINFDRSYAPVDAAPSLQALDLTNAAQPTAAAPAGDVAQNADRLAGLF